MPHSLLFSPMATSASLILAFLTIAGSLLGFFELSSLGFPDGHLTEYERASRLPWAVLLGAGLLLGLYCLRLAIANPGMKARLIRIICVVLSLIVLLAVAELLMPWYFLAHLGLDDGRGG